ncbi:MAG: ABC transporter ATP-binding protein [Eubacteriales bacterium]
MKILETENVFYDYRSKSGVTHALNGVSLSFEEGKLHALTGRSGSGKSTLLSLLAAFDKPLSGRILFRQTDLCSLNPTVYRREHVGIVFQSFNLLRHLTAEENVRLALEVAGSEKRKGSFPAELLLQVGLPESLHRKRPTELSGGEQQRVAVARAVASEPDVLLADEPTGNLDNANSRNILALMQNYAHEQHRCVIVVTHAEEIAAEADSVFHLSDGYLR